MYAPIENEYLNVFLTGATGGVGEAILSRLVERRTRLFITSRTQIKLDKLKATVHSIPTAKICAVSADLNFPERIGALVESAVDWLGGRIDVLINNAGIGRHCPVADISLNEATQVMTINAIAPMIITTYALPALRRSMAPKIINISSVLGSKPMPFTATYTASKHALNGFSKVLRVEEAPSQISVTQIEPGAIDSPFIFGTENAAAIAHFSNRQIHKLPTSELARWVMAVIDSPPFSCPEVIRVAPLDQAF